MHMRANGHRRSTHTRQPFRFVGSVAPGPCPGAAWSAAPMPGSPQSIYTPNLVHTRHRASLFEIAPYRRAQSHLYTTARLEPHH